MLWARRVADRTFATSYEPMSKELMPCEMSAWTWKPIFHVLRRQGPNDDAIESRPPQLKLSIQLLLRPPTDETVWYSTVSASSREPELP